MMTAHWARAGSTLSSSERYAERACSSGTSCSNSSIAGSEKLSRREHCAGGLVDRLTDGVDDEMAIYLGGFQAAVTQALTDDGQAAAGNGLPGAQRPSQVVDPQITEGIGKFFCEIHFGLSWIGFEPISFLDCRRALEHSFPSGFRLDEMPGPAVAGEDPFALCSILARPENPKGDVGERHDDVFTALAF